MFSCRKDNGPDYVAAAPYLRCYEGKMVGIAAALLAIYVIPFPLVSFHRFYQARENRNSNLFASLWEGNKFWWWVPIVLDGRRVLIAVVTSQLTSVTTALVPTVTFVLLANLITLLVTRPYKIQREKVLDASAVTIASIFLSLFTIPETSQAIIQRFANIFKVVAVVIATVTLFSKNRIIRKAVQRVTTVVSNFSLYSAPSEEIPIVEMDSDPALKIESPKETTETKMSNNPR